MDIIQILKDDYQRFPVNQTYSIYAADVYFEDPLNKFSGVDRYKQMINLIQNWFILPHMDLHEIHLKDNKINTQWTLSWNTPLPWKPRIAIPGRSELELNTAGLIASHIDYWHCSRFSVLKQHLFPHENR